jgi:hypothetical protein
MNHLYWEIKIKDLNKLMIAVSYYPLDNKIIMEGIIKQQSMEPHVVLVRDEIDLNKEQIIENFEIRVTLLYEKLIEKAKEVDVVSEFFKKIKIIELATEE